MADKHSTTGRASDFSVFYDNPTPQHAVALAIADHKGYAGLAESHEYVAQLRRAKGIAEVHDDLVAALQLIVKEIGPRFGRDDDEPGTLNIVARAARAALAKVSA